MRPIIGILGRPNFPNSEKSIICVLERYQRAIMQAEGIPFFILPPKNIDYNNQKASELLDLTNFEKEMFNAQLNFVMVY